MKGMCTGAMMPINPSALKIGATYQIENIALFHGSSEFGYKATLRLDERAEEPNEPFDVVFGEGDVYCKGARFDPDGAYRTLEVIWRKKGSAHALFFY